MMRTLARGKGGGGSGTALEIADQASETAEPKGATPETVPSTRSCDAATLNVHGCLTTSDGLSGSASASHGWDCEAGGGRVSTSCAGCGLTGAPILWNQDRSLWR